MCIRTMDLDALRSLVQLARTKQFTTAAKVLGLTQPTLSRQIQRLEHDLGAKLVVRGPREVVLTEAGSRFVARAEQALCAIDAGVSEVSELGGTPRGSVTVGALPTIAAYALPTVVATFHEKYPQVQLLVREGFSDHLESQVASGELDLGVVHYPIRREELSYKQLWVEDYLIAVPPNHRLATAKKKVPLESLIDEPFVVIPGMHAIDHLEAVCAASGRKMTIALRTENLESVRRMVEVGLGIALVPRLMTVEHQAWRAGLVELADPVPRRTLGVIHRGSGYLTAAAKAFRESLLSYARATKSKLTLSSNSISG